MFADKYRTEDQAQLVPAGSAQPFHPVMCVSWAQLTGRNVHSQRDRHQSCF